jgi:hypothetical protein
VLVCAHSHLVLLTTEEALPVNKQSRSNAAPNVWPRQALK